MLSTIELQLGVFRYLPTTHAEQNQNASTNFACHAVFHACLSAHSDCSRCWWHTHLKNHNYFDHRKNGIPLIGAPCWEENGADFWISILEAEFILEREHFLSLCRMRISVFWGNEHLTDRSITKRYLKSNIASWVEKSSTSRAFHAHDTWFYWSYEDALHEHFIASSGVWVWIKMLQLITKR